ncbi:MAG: ABC transporter permease [Actinobacteria bacterium HGW-Actinobacteria-4]|nr:MAG: ABC transporter permease [Actinobacteria bacterium HGW-Actinobacteria-4]
MGVAPPLAVRLANVVRLHLANPWTPIIIPTLILAVIFLANLAIWNLIAYNTGNEDLSNVNNGGIAFVAIYMLVVATQTMNSTFPFALGYGVTRRDFYLGSSALFLMLSAGYAAGITVFALIERATSGWGLNASFFAPIYLGDLNAAEFFWVYFTLLVFFFFLGAATAAVYVRWRTTGMLVFFGGLLAIIIASIWLLSITDSFGAVGQFFVSAGLLGSHSWSLAVSALMAIAGYALLRRATPRN